MGNLQAQEFAGLVRGGLELERALGWHLQSNHYPPLPSSLIPVCVKAIEHANDGEWDALVALPDGILYRGQPSAPVSAIVEAHHLESFIDQSDESYGPEVAYP